MGRLFLSSLIFILTLELGLRLVTRTNAAGVDVISRFALPPLRPSEVGVRRWLEARRDDRYLRLDPQLGWTIAPRGIGGYYLANEQGLRVGRPERVFTSSVPEGKVRVLGFGDSFVEGVGLLHHDTWPALIESQHPDVEVMNFGLQSYGTDQAHLRFLEDARGFEGDVAFLGIWPDNLFRNLSINTFYRDPVTGIMMPKPRYLLEEGDGGPRLRLVHHPAPLGEDLAQELLRPLAHREALALEQWVEAEELVWHPWYASRVLRFGAAIWSRWERRSTHRELYADTEGPAVRLVVAIARAFDALARERGMTPLVVMFPARDLPRLGEEGGVFPPTGALRDAGLDVLDLQPLADRAEAAGDSPYLEDGHLDRGGHALFVEALMQRARPALEAARDRRAHRQRSADRRGALHPR